MVEWVTQRQLGKLPIRKHSPEDTLDDHPRVLPPEVIEHQESAVEEILSQGNDFVLVQLEASRLDHVDEGMLEKILVRQPEKPSVGIHLHRRHLLQPVGKV